ncbi:MAG: hypothetical protein A2X11_12340 [Bacteroidetes bacterium GWE2_42_24]|nr:MAG: hypothetical protein A2X11_12340 [Bacteroidetes bacterium GWE2_42_24]OFY30568.1 MAG: hypothetical protein A2X09_03585 [Bacteroidetes bacterium GWF2_43_11]PKP17540.1 MAG: hypothetical protein CVU06_13050 [Bacteroidetes bacterium HGW-Bacteroidetes-22]
MNLKFAAIARGQRYSPNHIGNDAQILKLTIRHIEEAGHSVQVYDEDSITPELVSENYIFNMIRGRYALTVLQRLEGQGALVINPTSGVKNCYRSRLAKLLPKAGIPVPAGICVSTSTMKFDLPIKANPFTAWVKRGDVHAIHREDITQVYSENELYGILREYHRRGIEEAVVQEHVAGPVVKFYAVRGSGFFHWYFHEGTGKAEFNTKQLEDIAEKCANTLNVDIYGGDAVIGSDGAISIIDLNDWPSFAPVRDVASKHIAELIIGKAVDHEIKSPSFKQKAG